MRALLALLLLALGGCGATGRGDPAQVQRATEGPTAEEAFRSRFVRGYARLPTFEETSAFRDDLDRRVTAYLARRPELSTSPRASQFRFHQRVAVGMSREEVELLIGPPESVTDRPADMRAAARHFWPLIEPRARQMWVYPGGWRLYFDGDRLVDLTVTGKPPL